MGACGGKQKKKPDEGNTLEALRNSKIPIIWVLGGPGSGKGTQCEKLVKTYGFIHLSSGDLLREEVKSGSEKGQELNAMMQQGMLVPREVVLDLIKQAMLKNFANAKGYLIDGYPREVEQGEDFENKICPCTLILYYEVSDETMLERLLLRAQSSGRVDDNEETILKRVDTFHKISEPVMKKYQPKVANIKAKGTPDEIFDLSKTPVDRILSAKTM